jgi:NitT/TauT family transport system substrate-binding protein
MLMLRKLLMTVLSLVGISTGTAIHPAHAQTEVNFRLDWTLYGVHAPFFLAQERGYFAKEGLKVNILEGQGSATVMQLVAQGRDQLGLIDYSTQLYGVEQGLPIVAVARVVSDMLGVISPSEAPIKTPQELVGKIVAYAPSESSGIALNALLAKVGVDGKKISVLNPATGAKNALFLQKRVDAIPGNVNVQPAQLEAQGATVTYFKLSDFGLSMMAQGITANKAYLEKNPNVVRGFVKASLQALEDTRKDPKAAVDALIKAHPQQAKDAELLLKQMKTSLEGLETANTKGKPLGYMDAKDWEDMQNLLVQYGGLKKATPVNLIYSNDYLPSGNK